MAGSVGVPNGKPKAEEVGESGDEETTDASSTDADSEEGVDAEIQAEMAIAWRVQQQFTQVEAYLNEAEDAVRQRARLEEAKNADSRRAMVDELTRMEEEAARNRKAWERRKADEQSKAAELARIEEEVVFQAP